MRCGLSSGFWCEVEISTDDYLANPRKAHEQAERFGRVLVKDPSGMTRLVINSNESTESLLDKCATEAYPGELELLRKVLKEARYVASVVVCRCEPFWAKYDRHAPECVAHEVDDLRAAIAALPAETP